MVRLASSREDAAGWTSYGTLRRVMRKTSVYLTDDEAEGLRRVAIREGRPQAELIREGVRRVIADVEAQPRIFRSMGAGHGGGRPYEAWDPAELHEKRLGRR